MTDNDIIKALDRMAFIEFRKGEAQKKKVLESAVEIINSQKAEIERLEVLSEQLGNDVDVKLKYIYELEEKLETTRAEAIKEFAKKLMARLFKRFTPRFVFEAIEETQKEMVGEHDV